MPASAVDEQAVQEAEAFDDIFSPGLNVDGAMRNKSG